VSTHNSGTGRVTVFKFCVAPWCPSDGFRCKKLGVVGRGSKILHFFGGEDG